MSYTPGFFDEQELTELDAQMCDLVRRYANDIGRGKQPDDTQTPLSDKPSPKH